MRLINTSTLQLEEFIDGNPGQYAILSHRWEEQEISYQDFIEGRKRDGAGFIKIKNFCTFAASRGQKWAWVDACCIDKTSSAELTEAINSMFKWYAKAATCYAYLSDVPTTESGFDATQREQAFRQSEWYQRGWTLQELLAPSEVIFCDKDGM